MVARVDQGEVFTTCPQPGPFRDPALRRHFARFAWYEPGPGPVSLDRVEQSNVELLREAEAK